MISNNEISIGILASNKSRRMDFNKANLKIGDKTFLEHIQNVFSKYPEITIATNDRNITTDAVYDEHDGVGPMEGIYQILKNTNKKFAFICSVDMPFIKTEIVDYLCSKIDNEHDCFIYKDDKRGSREF